MIKWKDLQTHPVGAFHRAQYGTHFRVWAPHSKKVALKVFKKNLKQSDSGAEQEFTMNLEPRGYHAVLVPEAAPGDRYLFEIDGAQFADPASRFQPDGVHGPSEIVSQDFGWTDQDWKGVRPEQLTIYELHVGTFTAEGTFESAIPQLERLRKLGINAIEVMPVSQFSGKYNWGYDGVFVFAPQNSYGGPRAFKSFVDACHKNEIAVILDVVYNHVGPEGNVLPKFGDYFQGRYSTPWGDALNFDGAGSDEVKRYFAQNAAQWLDEFHLDGLRLDAVHAIIDESQHPLLQTLGEIKREIQRDKDRPLHLIAESDLNDPKILNAVERGGHELDHQWNDDFHHALRVELTGENKGYYKDYRGLTDLAEAYEYGTIFRDRYSEFRRCTRGRPFTHLKKNRLVVYSQNHDQIGNRPLGDRLIEKIGPLKQRLAAACVFLSPFTPQIFMGEEVASGSPFPYFVNHEDQKLLEAVRKGRREEFKDFFDTDEIPDPADESTFKVAQIDFARSDSRAVEQNNVYQKLIQLSRWIRQEQIFESPYLTVRLRADENVLELHGKKENIYLIAVFNFSENAVLVTPPAENGAKLIFDSGNPALPDQTATSPIKLGAWCAGLIQVPVQVSVGDA